MSHFNLAIPLGKIQISDIDVLTRSFTIIISGTHHFDERTLTELSQINTTMKKIKNYIKDLHER